MGQAIIFSSARKPSACTAAVSSLVVVIIVAGKHRAVQHPSLTFSPMRPEPE